MRIETEDYLVTQDKYNWIVQIKDVVKDSPLLEDKSKIGTPTLGEKAFFGQRLGSAFEYILHRVLLKHDNALTLGELTDRIDALQKEFREVLK